MTIRRILKTVAGIGTLLGALIGYYISARLFEGQPPGTSDAAVWFATASVGGPVFGVAGSWWRAGTRWQHIVALALLGGVMIGEGIHLLVRVKTQGNAG